METKAPREPGDVVGTALSASCFSAGSRSSEGHEYLPPPPEAPPVLLPATKGPALALLLPPPLLLPTVRVPTSSPMMRRRPSTERTQIAWEMGHVAGW